MACMLRSLSSGEAVAGVSAEIPEPWSLWRGASWYVAWYLRPAISTAIPARGGRRCYLLDLGANVDSPASGCLISP